MFIFFSSVSFGQKLFFDEFGGQGGVAYYMGDVNHSRQFYSVEPAFGGLIRKNFNPRVSARLQFMQINVKGNDRDFTNGYQQQRLHHFYNILYEASLLGEINFLDYNPWNRQKFSTYLVSGFAMTFANKEDKIACATIPIGMGFKYAYKKRFTISPEWVFRKTFTDIIDGLGHSATTSFSYLPENKQITNLNTKDWYSVFSLNITYNFSGSKKWCHAYGLRKKKRLYELQR